MLVLHAVHLQRGPSVPQHRNRRHATLRRYIACLCAGKATLWCYLIWYLVTVVNPFDPTPSIWLNSLGISFVIGLGLSLSVGTLRSAFVNRWQAFRLFMMPFAVSSFWSLMIARALVTAQADQFSGLMPACLTTRPNTSRSARICLA